MVGEELARRGHKVVHLTDTVEPYVSGNDEERDARIIDVDRWAAEFVPVDGFVEGHLAHLLPCERIVVLRCRPDVLKTRLSLRKYRVEKIWENTDAEAMDVCLIETVDEYEPSRILEIDTTDHDVPYCADQIERFVKGEIPAGFGTIDWSEFLEV